MLGVMKDCLLCNKTFRPAIGNKGHCSMPCRLLAKASVKPDGCWTWQTKSRNYHGYGVLRDHGRNLLAHRVSWETFKGPIPAGLWVLHRCDNPPCINPEHLFLGTVRDNQLDSMKKGRASPPPRNAPSGDKHWSRRHPERVKRGEQLPKTRLSEKQASRILKLYAGGRFSQASLASRFGVSRGAIAALVQRRSWKHLGGEVDHRV